MSNTIVRPLTALFLLALILAFLLGLDLVLDSASTTYHEVAAEIDQRDIDTGNATNFFGDDTSWEGVYQTQQVAEHPPKKPE